MRFAFAAVAVLAFPSAVIPASFAAAAPESSAMANPTTTTRAPVTTTPSRPSTTRQRAVPTTGPRAGEPSTLAKMICAPEAQADLAENLGVRLARPLVPTWNGRRYQCVYRYATGSFTLSVDELPDLTSARSEVGRLARTMGRVPPPLKIGDEAFAVKNHSVIVRKDRKILIVDVTTLPAAFGKPPLDPLAAAETIAITIMECWTGE